MNNPIAFKDPTGYLCEPGDCYSSGDSKDKDDLGVTLWVQNSFADNAAGQARYDWMNARMGSWVYSSINR